MLYSIKIPYARDTEDFLPPLDLSEPESIPAHLVPEPDVDPEEYFYLLFGLLPLNEDEYDA